MNIEGKKILITGAAKRVGRVIAEALAARGAELAIHYHTSEEEAHALCRLLTERGTRAVVLQADLTSESACEGLVREAVSRLGGLDVLVNNAAVFLADDLAGLRLERAQRQMMINFWAPMILSRTFAVCCGAGQIINMLDQRIARHYEAQLSYTLSKKALHAATNMLALELAPRFAVNAVAPGPVLAPDAGCTEHAREAAGFSPLRKKGTAEDVAGAVCYLIQADGITGQTLYVDGGQHLL